MKIFKKLTVTALTAVIAVTASFAGLQQQPIHLKVKSQLTVQPHFFH